MRSNVGVSALLQVDHEDLEEYEDENELDADSLVRYVESVAGENFTVKVKLHEDLLYPHDDIDVWVLLDGKKTCGKILSPRTRGLPAQCTFRGAHSTVGGQSYMQKFCFAELKTNDEATKSSAKKDDLKDLGTVSVTFTRAIKVESADPYGQRRDHHGVSNDSSSISEKSLKGRAISNRTSFAPKERIARVSYSSCAYPYGKEPFAEFTFKYRSRRDLQIEGILERSPSPLPLEERDPATLTRAELQQLLERRNQELQDFNRVKREKRERSATTQGDRDGDYDDNDGVQITSSKRRRTSGDSAVDVIDLTDD